MPRAENRDTSVHPYLARTTPPAAATNPRAAADPRPGSAPGDMSVSTTSASRPASTARTCASACAALRSGAKRKFTSTSHTSGTTLPATPPVIFTAFSPSR